MTHEPKVLVEDSPSLTLLEYNTIEKKTIAYTQSFTSEIELIQRNFDLKRDHITNVCGFAETLIRSNEFEEEDLLIAQLCALLHDIGRFEQMQKYQTFNDSVSEDHAQLGIKVIQEQGLLDSINENTSELILKVIENHNKLALPKELNQFELFHCKVLRDADKLDILSLAIKEYSAQNKSKNQSFTWDLEISNIVSKEVVKTIQSGKTPNKQQLKTTLDFKLMQFSYVFDLNFKKSYSILNSKQYVKQFFETLPKNDVVFELYRLAKIHVENQLM